MAEETTRNTETEQYPHRGIIHRTTNHLLLISNRQRFLTQGTVAPDQFPTDHTGTPEYMPTSQINRSKSALIIPVIEADAALI